MANPDQQESHRSALQYQFHKDCFICGGAAADGLGMRFTVLSDSSIEGLFDCRCLYQGYEGMVHGGILSALLDAAMTHCLFARGAVAVTARLIVRYLSPVAVGTPVTVRAWVCDFSPPLYVLEAELVQREKIRTKATAKFIDRDLMSEGRPPAG